MQPWHMRALGYRYANVKSHQGIPPKLFIKGSPIL
jgi:hypothetical protein